MRSSLLWLLLLFSPLAARPPKFSWGQDKGHLYITIQAECKDNRVVDIKPDHFYFSCDGPSEPYELQFVLREDVVPEKSHCNTTQQKKELCQLAKADEHLFDRLVDDPKPFKALMSTDWRVGRGERGSDDDDDDVFDAYSATPVTVLSPKKLNQTLAKHKVVVLNVNYRWCTKCRHTQDQFINLARTMKKEAFFGAVDALENRYARSLYKPTCEYTCYYYVHAHGEEPYKVKYNYDVNEQATLLRGFRTPLVTVLSTTEELANFTAAHPKSVVGAFPAAEDAAMDVFRQVARTLRGEFAFAMTTEALDGLSAATPAIRLFKPNSSEIDFAGDFLSTEAVVRFVNISGLPDVLEYDYQLRDKLDGMGLPGVHFFIKETDAKDTSSEMWKLMKDASKALSGRMYVMYLDDNRHSWMKQDYGAIDIQVGIQERFSDEEPKRYAYGGTVTLEGVLKFCEDYLAGLLKPSYKSEPIPKEQWQPGNVKKVVQKTLETEVTSENAVLIAFYKSWFAEWKEKSEMLSAMAKLLQAVPTMVFGTYDMSENRSPKEWFGGKDPVETTLVLLPPNGNTSDIPVVYGGKFKQAPVLDYVKKNVPAVEAVWADIAAELERQREERKAAKKEKKDREKAKKEREAAEEAQLATAERIDISGDGGVIKQILVEGSGDSPETGSIVQAHYRGKLPEGVIFDSSYGRGEPFSFTLGRGSVIKCWDQAFATMKVGEKAVLTCSPTYAYGAAGSPPKIPPNSTLRFDVELLGYQVPASTNDEL